MMGYIDDISEKLKSMKTKDLHEDFTAIAERLVLTNSTDLLPALHHIICQYDSVTRANFGLQTTVENLKRSKYKKAGQYRGGF